MISVRAGGKSPAGRLTTNFVLIIFWASYVIYLYNIHWLLHIHCLSLSAYICPILVTIGVYLSNSYHYRRIFFQCLSLSAYICPMPVTIGVYLSNACHNRPIFVQCVSDITQNLKMSLCFLCSFGVVWGLIGMGCL